MHDVRNKEARNHEDHECAEIRRKWLNHIISGGYEEVDVICVDCKKQFKLFLWKDDKNG